jgi:hypothetical protein
MTAYAHRHTAVSRWTGTPMFRAGTSTVARLARRAARVSGRGFRAMQYARLLSAMHQLPDSCLNQAGLRRSDLPEHCRRAVYGHDA